MATSWPCSAAKEHVSSFIKTVKDSLYICSNVTYLLGLMLAIHTDTCITDLGKNLVLASVSGTQLRNNGELKSLE